MWTSFLKSETASLIYKLKLTVDLFYKTHVIRYFITSSKLLKCWFRRLYYVNNQYTRVTCIILLSWFLNEMLCSWQHSRSLVPTVYNNRLICIWKYRCRFMHHINSDWVVKTPATELQKIISVATWRRKIWSVCSSMSGQTIVNNSTMDCVENNGLLKLIDLLIFSFIKVS